MSKFAFGRMLRKGVSVLSYTAGSISVPFAVSSVQVSAIGDSEKAAIKDLEAVVRKFFSSFDEYIFFRQIFNDLAIPPTFSVEAKDDQVHKLLGRYGDPEKFEQAKKEYIKTFVEHKKAFPTLGDFFKVEENDGEVTDLFPNMAKFFSCIDSRQKSLFKELVGLRSSFSSVFFSLESKINKTDLKQRMKVNIEEARGWLEEVKSTDIFSERVRRGKVSSMREKYLKISNKFVNFFKSFEEIINEDEGKGISTSFDESF